MSHKPKKPTHRPSSPSRRDFLQAAALGAAGVGAAMAFPTIVPSTARGADGKAPAPSERLTIGVIGLGKQGAGHHLMGKLVGNPAFVVAAVCDADTTRREHFKGATEKKYEELERKGYKGCAAYAEYHDVLARTDIDAVLIASPDHWHTAMVIESCKAKKDIYCEKPLTLTIAEAKACIDVVRKYERVFQTGSQQRSEGPFRDVAEYVRNGRLGKIKEVFCALGGASSKPCDLPGQPLKGGLEWDRWLGQAPKRDYNEMLGHEGVLPDKYPFNPGWRDFQEFSGGYVTDWGAHHFDITQWALGADASGPVEVRPPEKQGDRYGAQLIYRETPVGDEVVVHHVEKIPDVKEGNGILFVGEKGKVFVNRGKAMTVPDNQPFKTDVAEADKVHLFKSPGHHKNWLDCIRSREKPICDVEVGARSVTVCHLANLAYWHGKKLHWDPQKWEFTGENAAEANGWRSREQRAPYQLPAIS